MWRCFLVVLVALFDSVALVLVYLEVRRWYRRRQWAKMYPRLQQDDDPATRVPLEVRHAFATAPKGLKPDTQPWQHGYHGGPERGP